MQTNSLTKGVSRVLMIASALYLGITSAQAVDIPITGVDFGGIATTTTTLTSASLVRWRTGTTGQNPVAATGLSFQYLAGSNRPIPSRTNPLDNSANNQGYLWSDNAIAVNYVKGNSPSTAILIYTNNTIAKRAGLVNASQSSVLPLIWKSLSAASLASVSGANVNGSPAIPGTNPLFMPTAIAAATGGTCPAEGPYTGSTRTNNGFCDYSTHFMVDRNQPDFYALLAGTPRQNAFNYAAVVGPNGTNETEQGAGAGTYNPMYAVLGVNATSAQPVSYSTTIQVELRTL